MSEQDNGASVPDPALVSDQAPAGLDPSGFDPSRIVEVIEQLETAALHSELCAERASAIAATFTERFEAARKGTGPRYLTSDPLNFYAYVIGEEREVKRWKADAQMLRDAATMIRAASAIEARRAETGTGSVHESASDAQKEVS